MYTQLLIDGRWRDSADKKRFDVINPATGDVIAQVASAAPADALEACDSAATAQPGWAAKSPRERSAILMDCHEILIEHSQEIADLIINENGKPQADALGEVSYAAEFLRWNAEEAARLHGSFGVAPAGDKRMIVSRPPVGVVLMITPWNFPAAMITRKVAPALAAGNTVVVKPAKDTPLTALLVGKLLEDAGVPAGVMNIVPTYSAGEWFEAAVTHRAVRMVSFTGSTGVGRTLLRHSAKRVLKTAMELGGNAPFIVFADADLDATVEGAMIAKMRHSAQTCTAANRFFVETPIYHEFVERFSETMQAVTLGNGFDPDVTCGPLINAAAVARVDDLVDKALQDGAKRIIGHGRSDGKGFFYDPTVLVDVDVSSPITEHEIFGPVAPMIPFSDTDRMVEAANDTEMGLIAYVYTQDLARGLGVAESLEAGMVGVNRAAVSDAAAPFGGMKQSGLGREGASEGLYEFCETQYIAANW